MFRPASAAEVCTTHTPEHLETLFETSKQARKQSQSGEANFVTVGPWRDTYACEHTAEAALLAAGGAVAVVRQLLEGKIQNGISAMRPPGHHASCSGVEGFCHLNNVAIAANVALRSGRANRIMIVDWDVHHGNGTQAIFYDNPQVLYLSIHRYGKYNGSWFYPGTGTAEETGCGEGLGYTVNLPIPEAMGDEEYLAAFDRLFIPIANEFAPDLTIISAGFDAAKGDPLGGMLLTPQGFARMTAKLMYDVYDSNGNNPPVASILEGGYNPEGVAACFVAMTRVLLQDRLAQPRSSRNMALTPLQKVIENFPIPERGPSGPKYEFNNGPNVEPSYGSPRHSRTPISPSASSSAFHSHQHPFVRSPKPDYRSSWHPHPASPEQALHPSFGKLSVSTNQPSLPSPLGQRPSPSRCPPPISPRLSHHVYHSPRHAPPPPPPPPPRPPTPPQLPTSGLPVPILLPSQCPSAAQKEDSPTTKARRPMSRLGLPMLSKEEARSIREQLAQLRLMLDQKTSHALKQTRKEPSTPLMSSPLPVHTNKRYHPSFSPLAATSAFTFSPKPELRRQSSLGSDASGLGRSDSPLLIHSSLASRPPLRIEPSTSPLALRSALRIEPLSSPLRRRMSVSSSLASSPVAGRASTNSSPVAGRTSINSSPVPGRKSISSSPPVPARASISSSPVPGRASLNSSPVIARSSLQLDPASSPLARTSSSSSSLRYDPSSPVPRSSVRLEAVTSRPSPNTEAFVAALAALKEQSATAAPMANRHATSAPISAAAPVTGPVTAPVPAPMMDVPDAAPTAALQKIDEISSSSTSEPPVVPRRGRGRPPKPPHLLKHARAEKPIIVKKREELQEAQGPDDEKTPKEEERKQRLEAQRRAREERLLGAKEVAAQRRQARLRAANLPKFTASLEKAILIQSAYWTSLRGTGKAKAPQSPERRTLF